MTILRAGSWALRNMFAANPPRTTTLTILYLLAAVFPGLQVLFVRNLTEAITIGDTNAVLLWLVLSAVLVGMGRSIYDISVVISDTMYSVIRPFYYNLLSQALARKTPKELADADHATQARMARDAIGEVFMGYGDSILMVLTSFVSLVSIFVAVFTFSPWSAVLIVLSIFPAMSAYGFVAKIRAKAYAAQAEHRKVAEYYLDQLVYQRPATDLRMLGAGGLVGAKATKEIREWANIYVKIQTRAAYLLAATGASTAIFLFTALYIAYTNGAVTGLAASMIGIISAMQMVADTGYTAGLIIQRAPMVLQFKTFITPAENIDTTQENYEPQDAQSLVATNVTYTYPKTTKPALNGVSMNMSKGEIVAFVGPNGAGKTTLVNCLIGLTAFDSGTITVDDKSIDEYSFDQYTAHFGLLTQEFGRYEFSVRENLQLGVANQDVPDEAMWKALAEAKADTFIKEAGGLDCKLGQQWGGIGLSGGQWQRLALARIYMRNAGIMILDEPTSSVDAETEAEIFRDLAASKANKLIIVVSHRASTLRTMDRIYVIDKGSIVEQGTYVDLMKAHGRFYEMFKEQLAAEE